MKIHTCPNEDRETATDYGASWRWHAARTSLVSLRSTADQRRNGGAHAQRVCTWPQRKRSIAAPSAGSCSCTEKSKWHSSVPSTPTSHVRGRARERRERILHPHVARHDQVLLVVEEQLAERHVRSLACHVDVAVAWARTAVRGGRGPRSEESVCGRHLRRRPCSTRWRARKSRPTVRHQARA
jgi:hypothetical protein